MSPLTLRSSPTTVGVSFVHFLVEGMKQKNTGMTWKVSINYEIITFVTQVNNFSIRLCVTKNFCVII